MARCNSFMGVYCAIASFLCVVSLAGAESSLIESDNYEDSCEYIGKVFQTGGVVTMPAALSCLYSFPYNASLASAIADSVYNTYLFHTYSDISRDSPTKEFPMQVDVLGSLTEMKSKVYENDFAFNEAVFSLITSLNDGHAVYYPYCYVYSMASYTAFPLVKLIGSSGRSEVVKVSSLAGSLLPTVVDATEAALGIKVSDYAKATILEISGQDPIAFIAKFADGLGVYKDINARINQAYLRITGDGVVHVGAMMGSNIMAAPKESNITYKLQKSGSSTVETLTIPYFVSIRPTAEQFANASDFFTKNCLARPTRPPVSSSIPPEKISHRKIGRKAKRGVMADSDAHSLKVVRPDLVMGERQGGGVGGMRTLVDSFIKSFLLADSITGVMYVPNMEGPDGDFEQWSLDIYNGIKAIKEAGGTRLIIDVQENGGGYVVLAYELFEYLFPEVSEPQYPIQNPVPPLAKIMAERSIQDLEKSRSIFESPCQYSWFGNQDKHANVYYNGDDFFFPLQSRTYGGITSNFSTLYSFIDKNTPPYGSNTLDLLYTPIGDVEPKFQKSEVLILSNGACYSTCSIFAYVMQEYGVKIAAVGGCLNSPMAYSAGSVGYSYSLEDLIYAEVEYLNLTSHPDAPKALPVKAYVGLSCAQAFSPESDVIPADFIFKAADFRFPFNEDTVENVEELYKEAAGYFPKATASVGRGKGGIVQPVNFGRKVVR